MRLHVERRAVLIKADDPVLGVRRGGGEVADARALLAGEGRHVADVGGIEAAAGNEDLARTGSARGLAGARLGWGVRGTGIHEEISWRDHGVTERQRADRRRGNEFTAIHAHDVLGSGTESDLPKVCG